MLQFFPQALIKFKNNFYFEIKDEAVEEYEKVQITNMATFLSPTLYIYIYIYIYLSLSLSPSVT